MVAALLCSCGGGGSSEGAIPATPVNTVPAGGGDASPGLSETQALFEDAALASNGGVYSFGYGSTLGPTRTIISASITKATLPSSPQGLATGVMGSYLAATTLTHALPNAYMDETDERAGSAFVRGGVLRFIQATTPTRYTYIGGNIDVLVVMASGEVAAHRKVTSITKVALTGKFSEAPKDFLDLFGVLAPYLDPEPVFLPGAAYYRYTATRVGDALWVNDVDGNPATEAKSATPVGTGTIEQLAAANPAKLDLSHGTIKTANGARCWIRNASGPYPTFSGFTAYTVGEPSFGAYCQLDGKVYEAMFEPDGSNIGENVAGPGTENRFVRKPFYLRLNKAAVDSFKRKPS